MRSAVQWGVFLFTVTVSICAAGPASAQFSVSKFTVDGGGGRSTGGTFALGGTIGQPDAGTLAGGTFVLSGGFWAGGSAVTAVESDLPGDGVDLPAAAPLVFRLYPATPNPVAYRTAFAFDLPQASPVRAAVYDVSGRLVRTLVDEPLAAGKHLRDWDRRDHAGQPVASGIYFLRLEAGANQSRQKIVVVS